MSLPATIDDIPLDLSKLSAQIATELAAGLSDAREIRARYGISDTQWERLRTNDVFRRMVEEALRTWTGDMNAGQRITKKAEIILEDALPVLDTIAHDVSMPAETRINAIKQMESLTGRKAKEQGGGQAGGGFVLNINFGGEDRVVIEGNSEVVDNGE